MNEESQIEVEITSEDLRSKIKKANIYRDIVAMMLFGFFLQSLFNWTFYWNSFGIWHFVLTGFYLLLGSIFYYVYVRKVKKVEKLHHHEYNEKSLFCNMCGKYWNLKSCLYCNSKKVKFVKEIEDFGHFNHNLFIIECKDCGKSKKIDSFSSMHIKKKKLEAR